MKKVGLVLFTLLLTIIMLLGSGAATIFAQENDAISFECKSAYLMDYTTGKELYENNSNERMPVASIVKVMTLNIVFEAIESDKLKLDESILVSENASGMGGSQVFLDAKTNYVVSDLIKSVIIASANDASVALAEKIAGSEQAFVAIMNRKAQEMELNNTNFENCTGLPAVNQYSCAKDVAEMLKQLISHQLYFEYSTIWMDDLTHPSGRITTLTNTNKLSRFYSGCDAGKTGSTKEAKYCLVSSAKRDDTRLIAVVLGAENSKERFNQTSKLLNYGFDNFETIKIITKNEIAGQVAILNGIEKTINAIYETDFSYISNKSIPTKASIEIDIPANMEAPIALNQVIGKANIIYNNEVIGTVNIISDSEIKKETIFDYIHDITNNF